MILTVVNPIMRRSLALCAAAGVAHGSTVPSWKVLQQDISGTASLMQQHDISEHIRRKIMKREHVDRQHEYEDTVDDEVDDSASDSTSTPSKSMLRSGGSNVEVQAQAVEQAQDQDAGSDSDSVQDDNGRAIQKNLDFGKTYAIRVKNTLTGKTIKVGMKLAVTGAEHEHGLMFRKLGLEEEKTQALQLAAGSASAASADKVDAQTSIQNTGAMDGMAFVYPNANKRVLWMQNTFIPLDATWWSPEGSLTEMPHGMKPHDRTFIW